MLLRVVIAVIATLELAYFYIEMPFSFGKMLSLDTQWFNILSGYTMAMFAPLIALAALALAAAGRRLGVAAILLAVAPLVYWAPLVAEFIALMISMKGS